MAVDFALFLSPDGIALAHRQTAGHWALIGETSLEVPDLGSRLARLCELGEARAGAQFQTLLILPDDQILYTDMDVDAAAPDAVALVGQGLDGRTPYPLAELAFDFRASAPGKVQVAAVAQQTLTEAMDFARSAGFNGVGFAATPPETRFPGAPIFDLLDGVGFADTPYQGIPFGTDSWTEAEPEITEAIAGDLRDEPAQVFVSEAGEDTLAEAALPPAPEKAPEPEPVDDAEAEVSENAEPSDDRAEEVEAGEPDAAEPDNSTPDEIAAEADEPAELDPDGDAGAATVPDIDAAQPDAEEDEDAAAQDAFDAEGEAEAADAPEGEGEVEVEVEPESEDAPVADDQPAPEELGAPDLFGNIAPVTAIADASEIPPEPAEEEPASAFVDPAQEDLFATREETSELATQMPSETDAALAAELGRDDTDAPEFEAEPDPETDAFDEVAEADSADLPHEKTPDLDLEPEPELDPDGDWETQGVAAGQEDASDAPAWGDAPVEQNDLNTPHAVDTDTQPDQDRDRDQDWDQAPGLAAMDAPVPTAAELPESRRIQLDVAPDEDSAADPAADTASTKPARATRTPKTPALFAGGGDASSSRTDARVETLSELVHRADIGGFAEAGAESEAETGLLTAHDTEDPDAPAVRPTIMPPGLLTRWRQLGGEKAEDPNPFSSKSSAAGAGLATARVVPKARITPRPPAELDDPLLTGGLLSQRIEAATRPSLGTGLVLTLILLLVLALIAVWSALFLPDSRVAQLFGRSAPEVETADGIASPEVAETLETAALASDAGLATATTPQPRPDGVQPGTALAVTPPALPVAPRVPPPSLEEVEAEYAAYGIWQLAPPPPPAPARDFTIPEASDNTVLSALAPVTEAAEFAALIAPVPSTAPIADLSPPPFGSGLSRNGLVAATPDGVRTETGAFVVLAQPLVTALPRPGPVPAALTPQATDDAATAAGGLGDDLLAGFEPTPRPSEPDAVTEVAATDAALAPDAAPEAATAPPSAVDPDGIADAIAAAIAGVEAETPEDGSAPEDPTVEDPTPEDPAVSALAAFSPTPRPQAAAEAAIEATQSSELAVVRSLLPRQRPAQLASAAQAALASAGPAASASTASTATSTAPVASSDATVTPDIPSSASVSRTATVENVIDLGEISLIGVRGAPGNRVALVRLPSGRFVSVSVGDRLNGGRVAAIDADSLQYVRNGRNVTLETPGG